MARMARWLQARAAWRRLAEDGHDRATRLTPVRDVSLGAKVEEERTGKAEPALCVAHVSASSASSAAAAGEGSWGCCWSSRGRQQAAYCGRGPPQPPFSVPVYQCTSVPTDGQPTTLCPNWPETASEAASPTPRRPTDLAPDPSATTVATTTAPPTNAADAACSVGPGRACRCVGGRIRPHPAMLVLLFSFWPRSSPQGPDGGDAPVTATAPRNMPLSVCTHCLPPPNPRATAPDDKVPWSWSATHTHDDAVLGAQRHERALTQDAASSCSAVFGS